tara:strand:- start:1198 stop:1569 length:372 start_codon:yes stop_codon:yes gene_type:complete
MATFPSLEPTTRAVSLGDCPQQAYSGTSGDVVSFKFGTDRVGQVLTLGYEYLSESEAQQIIDHYRTQQGFLISFDLPSIVWSGYTTVPISATDYEWRYTSEPTIGITSPLSYSVEVTLESVII